MKSYRELIEQTFEFPQEEFKVWEHELLFNDVPLMDIIKEYGTPLKLTYLPRISENVRFVQATFNNAMERFKYNAKYTYCYCTKSSHFSFVLEEALKNNVHIETKPVSTSILSGRCLSAAGSTRTLMWSATGSKCPFIPTMFPV